MKQINLKVVYLLSLLLIIIVYGIIPFYSIPSLGQIVWASGFAESIAHNDYFFYADHFGIPSKAPIAFGLPGLILQSLLIRLFNLHASDAYSFMSIILMIIAQYGTIRFAMFLGMKRKLSIIVSLMYLTLPIVWWHTNYSFISFGFAFIPFYIYLVFRMQNLDIKFDYKLLTVIFFMPTFAIFMDGYTFMMYASSMVLVWIMSFFNGEKRHFFLLRFSLPFQILSLITAYMLYIRYLGVGSFNTYPLSYFRGFGVDLNMIVRPPKNISYIFDLLNLSVKRSNIEYFGDASVWMTSFSIVFIILGIVSYFFLSNSKYKLSLLIIALFGLYMSLGPSLKINSKRSDFQIQEKIYSTEMLSEDALCSTGSSILSKNLPGFKNMRAVYRWGGLLYVGMFGLIILGINKLQNKNKIVFSYILIFSVIILNLPNLYLRTKITNNLRDTMFNIDSTIIRDFKATLQENSKVLILPLWNDHFANYLASKTNIKLYNIGGDKNYERARKYWPDEILKFQEITPGVSFVKNIKNVLSNNTVDEVVIVYFDMLWSAYSWPRKEKEIMFNKKKYSQYLDKFKKDRDYIVIENDLFFTIKLNKNINQTLFKDTIVEIISKKYVDKNIALPERYSYLKSNIREIKNISLVDFFGKNKKQDKENDLAEEILKIKEILQDKDYFILPYFNENKWPLTDKELLIHKYDYRFIKDYFQIRDEYIVNESKYFVEISMDYVNIKKHRQLLNKCERGSCIFVDINRSSDIFYKVGKLSLGYIQTDGRAGTLLYGPYQDLDKGLYKIKIFGEMYKGSDSLEIVITSDLGKKIITKFKADEMFRDGIIFEKNNIHIPVGSKGVEIKIYVKKNTSINITKYIIIKQRGGS